MNSSGRVRPRKRVPKWLIPALGYAVSIICLVWVYQGFDWRAELPKLFATQWSGRRRSRLRCVCLHNPSLALEPRPGADRKGIVLAQRPGNIHRLFGNEVLPLRGGEVIRCYVQAKWNGLPFSVVISSALIERLIDGVWLAFGFWVVSQYVEMPGYMVARPGSGGAGIDSGGSTGGRRHT